MVFILGFYRPKFVKLNKSLVIQQIRIRSKHDEKYFLISYTHEILTCFAHA